MHRIRLRILQVIPFQQFSQYKLCDNTICNGLFNYATVT